MRLSQKLRIIFFVFMFSLISSNVNASRQEEFKMLKDIEKSELEEQAAASLEPVVRPQVEYIAQDQSDPFKEPVLEPSGAGVGELQDQQIQAQKLASRRQPALTVQGLIWGGRFPQAIINDKVVKEGDVIAEAQITKIEKSGVTVFFEGSEFNLPAPGLTGKAYQNP